MSDREWFLDDKVQLFCGDSAVVLRSFPDNSMDSCACDPPYALQSILKRFANSPRNERTENTENPYGRTGRGFMGHRWDTGDIAHSVGFWREVYRVLKPGAFLVAFAGTRTYHRLAAAIEDAGFEVRDMISWTYGSGFPKSHDIAKAVDRYLMAGWCDDDELERGLVSHTAAYLEGSGTAIKPAHEPICLARKPLAEVSVAQNVLTWGTGALNIDDCRIHSSDSQGIEYTTARTMPGAGQNATGERKMEGVTFSGKSKDGRWPANLVHDGSAEVVALFPEDAGAFAPVRGTEPSPVHGGEIYNLRTRVGSQHHGDEGSAARFFYTAKADADDRIGSKHPTVKPVDLNQWLVRLVTPRGGIVLDPFAGTGTTAEAAFREGMRCVLIERESEYQDCIRRRMRLVLAGPEERRRESIKAKLGDQPVDDGPLFSLGLDVTLS